MGVEASVDVNEAVKEAIKLGSMAKDSQWNELLVAVDNQTEIQWRIKHWTHKGKVSMWGAKQVTDPNEIKALELGLVHKEDNWILTGERWRVSNCHVVLLLMPESVYDRHKDQSTAVGFYFGSHNGGKTFGHYAEDNCVIGTDPSDPSAWLAFKLGSDGSGSGDFEVGSQRWGKHHGAKFTAKFTPGSKNDNKPAEIVLVITPHS